MIRQCQNCWMILSWISRHQFHGMKPISMELIHDENTPMLGYFSVQNVFLTLLKMRLCRIVQSKICDFPAPTVCSLPTSKCTAIIHEDKSTNVNWGDLPESTVWPAWWDAIWWVMRERNPQRYIVTIVHKGVMTWSFCIIRMAIPRNRSFWIQYDCPPHMISHLHLHDQNFVTLLYPL